MKMFARALLRRRPVLSLLATLGVAAGVAAATVHWGYHGEIGPDRWADLDPSFLTCRVGVEQTPIDLSPSRTVRAESPNLGFRYGRANLSVVNNGHTVQANLAAGQSIVLGGVTYALLQFHWHTPSEHTVEGATYPLEAHFVHRDGSGTLAVVGVFIKSGAFHPEADKIFSRLPAREGDRTSVSGVDIARLLPSRDDLKLYSYAGSLTTPPCSEGVRWSVLRRPIEMSSTQINRFVALFSGAEFPEGNARPVQPLNDRTVLMVEDD